MLWPFGAIAGVRFVRGYGGVFVRNLFMENILPMFNRVCPDMVSMGDARAI